MKDMMMKNEKIIFSDVDEVVVQWLPVFSNILTERGFKIIDPTQYFLNHHFDIPEDEIEDVIKVMNTSEFFQDLPPVDNSVFYARKIAKDFGYKFFFISACGDYDKNHSSYKKRMNNLDLIVGREYIKDLICVENSKEKYYHLKPYSNSNHFWIEDNIVNAEMGEELGFKSILYETSWNSKYSGGIQRVKSWKEIYSLVKEREISQKNSKNGYTFFDL